MANAGLLIVPTIHVNIPYVTVNTAVTCIHYTVVNLLSFVHTTQLSISCHLYILHSCQSPVTCTHYTVVNLLSLVYTTQLSISSYLYMLHSCQSPVTCTYVLHSCQSPVTCTYYTTQLTISCHIMYIL